MLIWHAARASKANILLRFLLFSVWLLPCCSPSMPLFPKIKGKWDQDPLVCICDMPDNDKQEVPALVAYFSVFRISKPTRVLFTFRSRRLITRPGNVFGGERRQMSSNCY